MRQDLENLLNVLLPAAIDSLKKHGEFFPIAAELEGEEATLQTTMPNEKFPTPADIIGVLRRAYVERLELNDRESDTLTACGICYLGTIEDATTGKPSDAIVVDLECPAESARVALPYRKRMLFGYAFGDLARLPMQPTIFAAS